MRDASGRMYMRNRYYDPTTGQFTQTDPVGVAGGLNAYGFAAGDAVSYSDPYGLCPEDLVKENGKCPGDWSHEEYDHIDRQARLYLSEETGSVIRGMLRGGFVRSVNATHYGEPAEADYLGGAIKLQANFFSSQTENEGAWMLGHELGHVIQYGLGMLIYKAGNSHAPSGRSYILGLFGAPNPSKGHSLIQNDANTYACINASDPGKWGSYCRGLGL
jgi:hypothetical protein